MFAPIQNVVATRKLFNSNPCRDFWDSQQFSQPASGSQSSQSSSLELLSLSKSSQNQKHESSYDGCYSMGSSQKTSEDEPEKYYMNYLSKPPLFADNSKGNQEKGHTENYKNFVEIQKTKAVERDQRELLDNFIGLLKEYTKEVQNAMQSFKDCLESSAASNNKTAESIKTAAEKSFSMVDELREDFQTSFKKVRSELKENNRLKSTLFEREQELKRLDMKLQLQKKQIDDLKLKELDAARKEDKFKRKEKRLVERVKEAEKKVSTFRDTPPLSQESLRQYGAFHPNINHSLNQMTYFPERNARSRNNCLRLPVTQEIPMEHNPYLQLNHSKNNVVNGNIDFPPVIECESLRHFDVQSLQSNSYPTASITPVQQSSNVPQPEQDNSTSPSILLPLAAHHGQAASILSPDANSLIEKNRLPRKSPTATVLPQVQVKPQNNGKSVVQPIATSSRKQTPQDPSCIFTFDLTSSQAQKIPPVQNMNNSNLFAVKKESSQCQDMVSKPKSKKNGRRRKRVFTKPAKKSGTRSQSKVSKDSEQNSQGNLIEHSGKQMKTAVSYNFGAVSENRIETSVHGRAKEGNNNIIIARVSSRRVSENSVNQIKDTVPINLKRKVFIGAAHKSTEKRSDSSCVDEEGPSAPSALVNKRPCNANGVGDTSKSIEGCLKSSFKRQNSEKRTLDLSGSSLFEIIEEEASIQEIAESIRKHAQKRKMR